MDLFPEEKRSKNNIEITLIFLGILILQHVSAFLGGST
jgi:hypothetical protein